MILNVLVYQPILDDLYHPNLDDSEDLFIPAKSRCFMCEHRVCYGFEVLKILSYTCIPFGCIKPDINSFSVEEI